MAVDTRNRRASWFGYCLPAIFVFPDPDNAIDAEDRLQNLWLYSGIAAAIPVVDVRATGVGSGPEQEKWRPKLPTISFAQRQREWKAHVAESEIRMSQIHTDAGKARREAIESERPKESVESQRARTRQHKKPGLKIQRPKFERQDKPQSHEPQRKFLNPQQRKQADALEAKQLAIDMDKRAVAETKVEKDLAVVEAQRLGPIHDDEEVAKARLAASKRRKTALVNLELARAAKKKARAAKKRKAKRKKK